MPLMENLFSQHVFSELLKSLGGASIFGVMVSYAIFKFMKKSWYQSNRPFVTAKIVPVAFDVTSLNLVLANTGPEGKPFADLDFDILLEN